MDYKWLLLKVVVVVAASVVARCRCRKCQHFFSVGRCRKCHKWDLMRHLYTIITFHITINFLTPPLHWTKGWMVAVMRRRREMVRARVMRGNFPSMIHQTIDVVDVVVVD